MNTRKTYTRSGLGLLDVLFVVFLVLRLLGVITWSWWWVTAPIWIPVLFFLVIILIWVILQLVLGNRPRLTITRKRK